DRLARERNGPIGERHIWRIAGRELTILATHFPLYRSDALPYAICSVFRDATDLVEAQRELERLWLHAPDPLCVTGFDGYLKQLNPAWSRLLGWTEAELLARPYAEFVHPDDRAGLADVAARFSEGETVRGYETRCRCRDGSYRWFSWSAIPTVENHTVYGIARDVTEERRLTEQFHQAQKMEAVGQLASGVAHDFNNLLTVINGYSELLLSETLVADSRRDALAQIQAAGQRAAELTSQLLAFGRKAIVEPKLVDVNQILESSARLLRRLIGENVHLETHLTEVPPVKIDPGQLEQVFMNLAVNARDALPHGGRITIRTETIELAAPLRADCGEIAPGRYVQVSVADGGAGMTPEVQARIFEPFFTTKGPGKGTGLGLAMVYGIVRQANGTITVESQLGVGTTFRILLRAEQEPVGRQKSSSSKAAPRGTETVLIVEDEGGVGNFARDVLETHGYTVLAADTGTAALRILREHSGAIDLLLTDVVMPDVGGREVAEHARRRRP
ncbi:MAG TPA: ATP-binding protein, partial [Pirellulales bacterium]